MDDEDEYWNLYWASKSTHLSSVMMRLGEMLQSWSHLVSPCAPCAPVVNYSIRIVVTMIMIMIIIIIIIIIIVRVSEWARAELNTSQARTKW